MVWQGSAAICDPMRCRRKRISLVASWFCTHVHSIVRAIVIVCTRAPPRRGFFVAERKLTAIDGQPRVAVPTFGLLETIL
jgi:hypothetical protein